MLPPFLVGALRAVHVLVSVAALLAGVAFVSRLASGHLSRATSAWFVALTLLTSLTALVIHPLATGPAHIGGFVSIALLIPVTVALGMNLPVAPWRFLPAACGLAAFYINALAAVVTAFQFEPHLQRLTPSLAHPPLAASQLVAATAVPSFALSLASVTAGFALVAWPIWRSAGASRRRYG